MSNDTPVLARGTASYVIASICVLTALLHLVAGFVILNRPDGSALLSTADSATLVRILSPIGIAAFALFGFGLARHLKAR